MEIKKGTLVACDFYGFEEGKFGLGKDSPPNEKRAWGVVIVPSGSNCKVMLVHPVNLRGRILWYLKNDLTPVAQTTENQSDKIRENVPEILLSLVRENDNLKREVSYLKKVVESL